MLDINKSRDDIKKVDGTNFGCPVIGFYDYPFVFLERLYTKYIAEQGKSTTKNDFTKALSNINIADTVVSFLLNLSTRTDISP